MRRFLTADEQKNRKDSTMSPLVSVVFVVAALLAVVAPATAQLSIDSILSFIPESARELRALVTDALEVRSELPRVSAGKIGQFPLQKRFHTCFTYCTFTF